MTKIYQNLVNRRLVSATKMENFSPNFLDLSHFLDLEAIKWRETPLPLSKDSEKLLHFSLISQMDPWQFARVTVYRE